MATKQVTTEDTTTAPEGAKQKRTRKPRKAAGGFSASFQFKDPNKMAKNVTLNAKNAKEAISKVKALIESEPDEYANSQVLVAQLIGRFDVKSKTTVSLENA